MHMVFIDNNLLSQYKNYFIHVNLLKFECECLKKSVCISQF